MSTQPIPGHARAGRHRRRAAVVAAALLVGALAGPVNADHNGSFVREWNAHALNAIFNQTTTPPTGVPPGNPPGAAQPPYVGVLHMAMVQGAVYDAVNAIEGSHQPYNEATGSADSDASVDAAIVTAAYDVLSNTTLRLPAPTLAWLATEHANSMAEIDAVTADGPLADGIAAGHAAATAMLSARSTDGRYPSVGFFHPIGEDPGEWRPVGTQTPDQFAWAGNVTPFSLNNSSQLRSEGPPRLSSKQYAAEYEEVRTLGVLTGSSRTQAQTAVADFYQPNPVVMFNLTFRNISQSESLSAADEARLFGMLNIASADAAISCWNDKSFWSFWRPITAIRTGNDDGNKYTVGDGTWTPYIPTGNPPYPDHPSGYNCITGAMMQTAAGFFGTDEFAFQVVRPTAGSPFRTYSRFTDVVGDTIDARVYQGIHFRSADVQGAEIGRKAAKWLQQHEFAPTN